MNKTVIQINGYLTIFFSYHDHAKAKKNKDRRVN